MAISGISSNSISEGGYGGVNGAVTGGGGKTKKAKGKGKKRAQGIDKNKIPKNIDKKLVDSLAKKFGQQQLPTQPQDKIDPEIIRKLMEPKPNQLEGQPGALMQGLGANFGR
ncbi:MAG: hypothetical protein KF760_15400 [Candidatus Eremiobacteraeota bacterium]|nr:hypothetical protein [Candidatus Eremiobacteraeota bacterium]MCW5869505.1 hypothetical protein [Candidatus Eremiobacteraeota bacterium]